MSKSNNNDKLIEMVKSHPMLFDVSHPDYKNMCLRNKKWDELGAKLNMTGDDVKGKWRNLRDTYSKYLKSFSQITQSYNRYSKWQWASSMEFLKNYSGFASIDTSNIAFETGGEKETSGTQNVKERECNNSKKLSPTPPLSKRGTPRPRFRKRNHDHPVEKVFSHFNSRPERYTSTEHVMLGYAKTIDGFSERRKIITKMKIAQILMEAELEEEEEKSQQENIYSPIERKISQNDRFSSSQQSYYSHNTNNNSDPQRPFHIQQDAIISPSPTDPLDVKVEIGEVQNK